MPRQKRWGLTGLVAGGEGLLPGGEGGLELGRELVLGIDNAVDIDEAGKAAGAEELGSVDGEIVGAHRAHLQGAAESWHVGRVMGEGRVQES